MQQTIVMRMPLVSVGMLVTISSVVLGCSTPDPILYGREAPSRGSYAEATQSSGGAMGMGGGGAAGSAGGGSEASGGAAGAAGQAGAVGVPGCLEALFADCPADGGCRSPVAVPGQSRPYCFANGVGADFTRTGGCNGQGSVSLEVRKADGSTCYTTDVCQGVRAHARQADRSQAAAGEAPRVEIEVLPGRRCNRSMMDL